MYYDTDVHAKEKHLNFSIQANSVIRHMVLHYIFKNKIHSSTVPRLGFLATSGTFAHWGKNHNSFHKQMLGQFSYKTDDITKTS